MSPLEQEFFICIYFFLMPRTLKYDSIAIIFDILFDYLRYTYSFDYYFNYFLFVKMNENEMCCLQN